MHLEIETAKGGTKMADSIPPAAMVPNGNFTILHQPVPAQGCRPSGYWQLFYFIFF